MGSFCCCPCIGELEEYGYSNNSMYRNCTSLRLFFYQLYSGYTVMFHRLEVRPAASPIQGTNLPSTIPPTDQDGCQDETHPTVPRAFPYDPDQRYSRLQRDGLVSRRDKFVTQFQEEQQPLRRTASSSGTESMGLGKKRVAVGSEQDSIVSLPESSGKGLGTKLSFGLSYLQTSSEDEDVCPTCLDEYTPENPKITTRCSHHFHLGCIYEWLERSESCPICGKEMEFCESP